MDIVARMVSTLIRHNNMVGIHNKSSRDSLDNNVLES